MKKRSLPQIISKPLLSLLERYVPRRFRAFRNFILVITAVLLGTVLVLGWLSSKKVREVVTEDFNQQQLILARYAAKQIENSLDILRRDMVLLSHSLSAQHVDEPALRRIMRATFPSIRDQGTLAIRYVNARGRATHVVDGRGYRTMPQSFWDREHLGRSGLKQNRDAVMVGDVVHTLYEDTAERLIMDMARPVWTNAASPSRAAKAGGLSGVLVFVLDAALLVEKTTVAVRSGKTGYVWVIDHKGVFLYHPEREFIGKNAFEVRKEKQPTISFAKINEIQKDLMLTGKEGASAYISGWHGGKEGRIKKLIAYSPVRLDPAAERRFWSVAVVAPVSEVEDSIHAIQVRQFLLEGIVILAIVLGGLILIGAMLRWSGSLSAEVEEKTKELRKSERQYRSLIENANDIIFTADRNGVITSINRAGLGFYGKSKDEIIGVNIGEICFNEKSALRQLTAIEEVFETREASQLTYPVYIKGEVHWLSTSFNLLFEERGVPSAVLGISRDISLIKRKEKEEQMHHADKLASMGTLAAGVAHEINNPLAIILGFADMLMDRFKPDSEEYDILKTMEKQGLNAKRVVENLLSFARYTEYREEPVDVNQTIETVLSIVRNTLQLNKVSLKQDLRPGLPKVLADAGELEQVFLNIINNAMHAMKNGGILTISASSKDEHVELRFADTGQGIKKEHRSRIFDPLFTTKKVGEGTGLGLSVSYGIITKHGGAITFETRTSEESDSPGTTFIITLPALKTEGSQVPPDET